MSEPRPNADVETGDASHLAMLTQQQQHARVQHLFRISRRDGRIHPLQHLIERYRVEHPVPMAGAPEDDAP